MVPFVSYVSLGQSKLRLTFSHINGRYVLNFASVTSAVEQLKFLIWKWHQMNLIVFEKPLIIKSWLYFSVRNVRSLLHEVKTGKKSWSMEKQAGFKLHVTLVCYAINFCKFVPYFLSCYEHERYTWSFLLWFIQRYLCLPFFAVRFEVTFERLAKTLWFLKMIYSGYSRL